MSGWTIPRFALIGLLAVSIAPAAAQEGGFQIPINGEGAPLAPKPPQPPQLRRPDLRYFAQFDMPNGRGSQGEPVWSPPQTGLKPSQPAPIPPVLHQFGTFTGPVWRDIPATLPPVVQSCPTCETRPDAMQQMAIDAFGGMLIQSGITQPIPQQCPQTFDYTATQVTVTPFATAAAPAKPGIVGTWYRDFGSGRGILKITPDHFIYTLTVTGKVDGEPSKIQFVLTADYHLMRDGTTILALVTGMDSKCDGDDDGEIEKEVMRHIRRRLEDQPIAMSVRAYDDSLVIGNVRMPGINDSDDLEVDPFSQIGGRYTNTADKSMSKQKVTKGKSFERAQYASDPNERVQQIIAPATGIVIGVPTGMPGTATLPAATSPVIPMPVATPPMKAKGRSSGSMTLPSGRYLEHFPQYFPPDPSFPLPREMASEGNPPMMTPPVLPVPQMSEPIPPSVSVNGAKPASIGPIVKPLDSKVPVEKTSADHRQLVQFSIDLFRCDEACVPSKPKLTPTVDPCITLPPPPPTSCEKYESPVPPMMTPPALPAPSMSEPTPPGVSVNEGKQVKPGERIQVPALGPIGTALDFKVPLNKTSSDHRQLVNFSVGVFGGQ